MSVLKTTSIFRTVDGSKEDGRSKSFSLPKTFFSTIANGTNWGTKWSLKEQIYRTASIDEKYRCKDSSITMAKKRPEISYSGEISNFLILPHAALIKETKMWHIIYIRYTMSWRAVGESSRQ